MSDLPHDLAEIVRQRKLIPVIGAGFSKNIHPDFPDWEQVINLSAKILGYHPSVLKLYGDYLQIAEFLNARGELGRLQNDLILIFKNPAYKIEKSQPHLLLSYLDVKAIYTTNWDSAIEQGFEYENISYEKIATVAHFKNPKVFSQINSKAGTKYLKKDLNKIKSYHKTTQIFKLHGDLDFHESFVLRESDYFDRLNFEHPLDVSLRSDIMGRALLFIGYSFSDINIRYLWYRFMKQFEGIHDKYKSYFVTFSDNPLQQLNFSQNNIEIILLDSTDKRKSLESFLSQIINIQKS